jgi:hypothetical protein
LTQRKFRQEHPNGVSENPYTPLTPLGAEYPQIVTTRIIPKDQPPYAFF